ncbi:FadR family transcriptional regulator [Citrobacter amalonaticus]|uniref:FadR family transcriptional regulator n=2 Tax=Citrobacter amalonaticus TaxID=35703 RepID=A0A2S4RT35_CITAM|nr:FadR family transcriptional regulator [Citrobacter amalonaticus]POT71864.1 FadR family transcriptional regulator [Citrobacter amalonaticus]POU63004.1 FadR family transcriptional regulator [Citrobacter amalonaticus]POV04782.1 FadR family transcriptional regulator [Citrobacter amalonaticus]
MGNAMDVTALKKTTLTEQIMDQIASQITSGKLKPGQRLPNERAMGEMFKVTRSRVREALRALSLIGLIEIKPGDGSYVCENKPQLPEETMTWIFHKEIHNLDEIYAARKLIEEEVYLTAVSVVNHDDRIRFQALIDQMAELISRDGQPEAYHQLLDEYDLLMGRLCGNQIYDKLMQTIVMLRKDFSRKLLNADGAMAHSFKLRLSIHEAFIQRDKVQLRKNLKSFYNSSRKFYDSIADNTDK